MLKNKKFAFQTAILLALLCISPALTQEISEPEIIFHNANVITFDETMPNGQAVAIGGNLILAVGSNTEVLATQIEGTRLIDLQGQTIIPGLIDAHSHCLLEGFRESGKIGLMRATEELAAYGYTTVHELYGEYDLIAAARELAQEGKMAVRLNAYIQYNTNCGDNHEPWMTYPYTEKKDTTLRVVGVKIFADGGSCGCEAITTPFQMDQDICGEHGDLFKTQEEMNAIVSEVQDAGYPIAMHAIGDSAIGVGLNAFENAFAGQGNVMRSRMEHLRVMREDLADKMAMLGIAASIQYTWAIVDRAWVWETYYLPEVLEWCYAWRRMADRGIPIVGSNDCPNQFFSRQALQTISLLATRKTDMAQVLPDWMANNGLTIEEGLRAMTVTNAWIAFEENVKGSITAGKLSDLVVLSDDPLTIDAYDVRHIAIEMTIMDGVIRYDRSAVGKNIAVKKPVSASNSLASSPPEFAVDGNLATHWGAGDFPPQWIEINLEAPYLIKGIRLTTDQFPNGETSNLIWGKSSDVTSEFELLHELTGFTSTEQVLDVTPFVPWPNIQYLKIETVQSPSWVAWREIEILTDLPTSVSTNQSNPETYTLSQNYPNPFNPTTRIQYQLPQTTAVTIAVFNMKGQLIATLVDEVKPAGVYSTIWSGTDFLGNTAASGVYFLQLKTKEFTKIRKMLLIH